MISLKKIFYDECLSIEDLTYLSKLLDTNMPLNECFELISNNKNKNILNSIKDKLNEGVLIEKAIKDYLPKQIKSYVLALLNNISFTETLSLSLDFYESNTKGSNELLNSIAYPCILLFISISAIYLFDLYGIDSIMNVMNSFTDRSNLYQGIRMILRIVINIFYILVLITTGLFVYYLSDKRIVLMYIFFSKYFPNSLINIYYSEQFMSLLLICISKGYKTKQSLTILKKMKSKPIISFLAFHLDEALLQGESLKQAISKNYYDSSLSRFIKIANYTNDFSNIISSYIELSKQRIKNKLKKYTLTIQLSTYLFIGLIVIFIYQILFMPMQAISLY